MVKIQGYILLDLAWVFHTRRKVNFVGEANAVIKNCISFQRIHGVLYDKFTERKLVLNSFKINT